MARKWKREMGTPAVLQPAVMEQLRPEDELHLLQVLDDPGVQEALTLLADARATRIAHVALVELVRAYLRPAILRAQRWRKLELAVTRPDHNAMAAAARQPLDVDTRLALETITRRKPAAKDATLWQDPRLGAVGYLVEALRHERGRISVARGGIIPSARDVEVYDFVEVRPRGGRRAPEWWASLFAEWNATQPSAFTRVRPFQDAYRRGRRAATELPLDEALPALETREADRRTARERVEEVLAIVQWTPATRRDFERDWLGDPITPQQRQKYMERLKEAAQRVAAK